MGLRCKRCGKVFGDEDALEKHSRIEHGSGPSYTEIGKRKFFELTPESRAISGFLTGFLIFGLIFAVYGFATPDVQEQQNDPIEPVQITVITCDSCSYEGFRDETNSIFPTNYTEIDYQSDEAQSMIQKYDITYVPAFIFEKEVDERENFKRINSTLKSFDDAYVVPDDTMPFAQRLSDGFDLQ